MNLTKKQSQILHFISQYISKVGYPPSIREIASHFRIKGISAVKKHLDALERKGYLSRGSGARCIEMANRPRTVTVPVLGQVAAGRPILAEENLLGTLAINQSAARWKDAFFLIIKGDSMIDAGILEGDYVLVKKQSHAENSDIVVALVEDEATVKRFFHKGSHVVLQPENPAYQPTLFRKEDNLKIIGKVMGVVRLPALF